MVIIIVVLGILTCWKDVLERCLDIFFQNLQYYYNMLQKISYF